MRRETYMPRYAVLLKPFDIIDRTRRDRFFKIGFLVDTVDKGEVDIIGLESAELPVHAFLYSIQVGRPAVRSAAVFRPEMYLKIYVLTAASHNVSKRRKRYRVARSQIEVIDSLF